MLYLYSGKCRLGTVGQPTRFVDASENRLFVGDIVVISNDSGIISLTAVVSDEFTTYSNGFHSIKDGPVEHFVMGIKSVDLDSPGTWAVSKVKDHSDVISGEHWKSYGFSYKDE